MTKEVSFEQVDGAINDRVDEAYRAKYKGSSYLKPMIAHAPLRDVKVMRASKSINLRSSNASCDCEVVARQSDSRESPR